MDGKLQEKKRILRHQKNEETGCILALFLGTAACGAAFVLPDHIGPTSFPYALIYRISLILGTLIVLSFLAVFLILHGMKVVKRIETERQKWFDQYGKVIQATIIEHIRVEKSRGDPIYEIELEWYDKYKEQKYLFKQQIGKEKQSLSLLPIGTTLPVSFDPDDPSFYLVAYKQALQQSL